MFIKKLTIGTYSKSEEARPNFGTYVFNLTLNIAIAYCNLLGIPRDE